MQETTQKPGAPMAVFDHRRRRRHRSRKAVPFGPGDFLHARVAMDLVDRLESVNRQFPSGLFVGAGHFAKELADAAGVTICLHADASAARLAGGTGLVFDEDANPIADSSLDLIVSVLSLHAANDPVGAMIQIRRALKPDGLFLGAVFCADTLTGMRQAFLEAEAEITGGAASRFHPMADVRQWGNLMARAGFNLVVSDEDRVEVTYRSSKTLIDDLRFMGETNALAGGISPLSRSVFALALKKFAERSEPERFDIGYLTGWAPHESQQKPARRGSAKISLAEGIARAGATKPG